MFQNKFITTMSAVIIFFKIQGSTNITIFQNNHYLNLFLRLFTVFLREFFIKNIFLIFLPQFGQNSLSQSFTSPQEQIIFEMINLFGFNGLWQSWQNLAEMGFLCPQTQTICEFSFFFKLFHNLFHYLLYLLL